MLNGVSAGLRWSVAGEIELIFPRNTDSGG